MEQLTFDLPQNKLQDKYLQARELIIRFISGDKNVAQDAAKWIEQTNVKHAENKHHAGMHKQMQRSSNIKRISLYENDEDGYPLVVEFKDGLKYAYAVGSVTYNLPDGTSETKTAGEVFGLLCQEDDDPSGSVGHLFHHLIKRTDNKETPIKYKKI